MSAPHRHAAGHGEHRHHHGRELDNERRLLLALMLTGGFMLVEVIGGVLAGSLALIADAGHMLTDTAALGLSWYAFRMSHRPATPERSYGHHRIQVLAALVNGGTLIGVAVWIVLEAIERLFLPLAIHGETMLAIALIGLMVNLGAFLLLKGGASSLTMRGALAHVVGDLVSSAATILAAGVILLGGWTAIDPLLSILVAVLILRSAWLVIAQSWHVLMEGAPEGIEVAELKADLARSVPGVIAVHHVHLWSLTPERPLVTLHATIAEGAGHDGVLHALQARLAERYGLTHATIQVERRCLDGHAEASGGLEPRQKLD
jgi:cobalt-zinc-cadmium efflux system protein